MIYSHLPLKISIFFFSSYCFARAIISRRCVVVGSNWRRKQRRSFAKNFCLSFFSPPFFFLLSMCLNHPACCCMKLQWVIRPKQLFVFANWIFGELLGIINLFIAWLNLNELKVWIVLKLDKFISRKMCAKSFVISPAMKNISWIERMTRMSIHNNWFDQFVQFASVSNRENDFFFFLRLSNSATLS